MAVLGPHRCSLTWHQPRPQALAESCQPLPLGPLQRGWTRTKGLRFSFRLCCWTWCMASGRSLRACRWARRPELRERVQVSTSSFLRERPSAIPPGLRVAGATCATCSLVPLHTLRPAPEQQGPDRWSTSHPPPPPAAPPRAAPGVPSAARRPTVRLSPQVCFPRSGGLAMGRGEERKARSRAAGRLYSVSTTHQAGDGEGGRSRGPTRPPSPAPGCLSICPSFHPSAIHLSILPGVGGALASSLCLPCSRAASFRDGVGEGPRLPGGRSELARRAELVPGEPEAQVASAGGPCHCRSGEV